MPAIALSISVLVLLLGGSETAMAYVGPGAGLSLLGSALGLLFAIFMAIGVVLVWPIRRLIRRNRQRLHTARSAVASGDSGAEPS